MLNRFCRFEKHIELEQRPGKMAADSLEALERKKMAVQEYLQDYLLTDENKLNQLLSELGSIKKGMYPYR